VCGKGRAPNRIPGKHEDEVREWAEIFEGKAKFSSCIAERLMSVRMTNR